MTYQIATRRDTQVNRWINWPRLFLIGTLAMPLAGCAERSPDGDTPKVTAADPADPTPSVPAVAKAPAEPEDKPAKDSDGWISMFDGKTLDGWKVTNFGGEGDVTVKDGTLVMDVGSDMTGVTWTGELPKIDYEVAFEAMRVDGTDFFCGLTFPVKDDSLSLIIGGWGGGVCGLSSLDDFDASENDTTTYREFEKGKWYRVRLRVTEKEIQAWVDDKLLVDQEITGRKLSIRIEVDLSKPFGFATWQTTGALRDIRIRRLASTPSD